MSVLTWNPIESRYFASSWPIPVSQPVINITYTYNSLNISLRNADKTVKRKNIRVKNRANRISIATRAGQTDGEE